MQPQAAAVETRLVRELQERAARALPASVQQRRDGCWLRHSDSSMWWVAAALPHGPAGGVGLRGRIAAVEHFYAGYGSPVRIQVCPACPAGLAAALSDRNYRRGPDMALQVAATSDVARQPPARPLQVATADRPEDAWLALWLAVHAPGADPGPELRLLALVEHTCRYVTVAAGGQPVAIGRAVIDRGWAGVFGMATLPAARGQGAGRLVLAALAGWAREQGAPRMYLQVEQDNAAALHLYRRAGFRQLCSYHYRCRTPGA